MSVPLITLTTDFGESSPYVAAMKGVILSINPDVCLLDLTHQIPPQDLMHTAFYLENALPYFPPETIHLIVVDPGVGTDRAPLYVECQSMRLIVPDNGCWTWAIPIDEPTLTVRHLNEPSHWRDHISATFHGRDVFAPVAAHLSMGIDASEVGSLIHEWTQLTRPVPTQTEREIEAEVLFVDHFGNLITNVPGETFLQLDDQIAQIFVGECEVTQRVRTYGEAEPGSLVALVSSNGTLEIAVAQGNASRTLQMGAGTRVRLTLG